MEQRVPHAAAVRAAFAVWNGRIAPLFDVTRQLHFVEFDADGAVRARSMAMPDVPAVQKAARLVEAGTQVLVCGAISQPLLALVTAHGIRVIPFVAGAIDDVQHALVAGAMDERVFAMPGWRKRRHLRRSYGMFQHSPERRLQRKDHDDNEYA